MGSQNNVLKTILSTDRTVFTTQSMVMLTGISDGNKLANQLHYYVKNGDIKNPRKGVYTKPEYDERELACAIFSPAYISLEYVLQRSGVTFQYDGTINVISYLSRTIEIDGKTYSFRQINPVLWSTMEGIVMEKNYTIATPERAFLDMLYLSAGECYFDNTHSLNKTLIRSLMPLYQSKTLISRVNKLI